MRQSVELEGARSAINQLNGGASKWRREMKRAVNRIGALAVTVGRDAMTTEKRSAQRVRSYGHRAADLRDGVQLDVGPIRPSVGGRVAIHSRVLEGFNAAGIKVKKFTIKAKNGGHLHFPIRKGPGLSKSNIVAWAKVKQVEIEPDPTFPAVDKFTRPRLERAGGEVFQRVLG